MDARDPVDAAQSARDGERHRRRMRRLAITGGVITAVLAIVVGGFAYLWAHSGGRPVSLEEARRRFLEQQVGDLGTAGTYRPAEGVYSYSGSGSESLSSPPKSQDEGPEMPGTVSHADGGCWTFRLDYSTNHWRVWKFCADADGLREVGTSVYQRWDFVVSSVDNLTEMHCKPPAVVIESGMQPGDAWESECRGTSSQISGTTISTGTHRFVGRDGVEVAGRTIDALHFREERAVSGAQSGTEVFDLWLTDQGLPIQGRQRIVVDSDSPIGRVTYTQEGAFVLVSALP
ncbi:MAG: hypothetical protein WDA60_02560 [Acidimicrobiia bacterium]